jgi:hypothetical protein
LSIEGHIERGSRRIENNGSTFTGVAWSQLLAITVQSIREASSRKRKQ